MFWFIPQVVEFAWVMDEVVEFTFAIARIIDALPFAGSDRFNGPAISFFERG